MRDLMRIVVLTLFAALASPVLADTWTVVKMRGQVMQLDGSTWLHLERGDTVSDERFVRTGATGRAALVRGNETVELGPNTQIRIIDKDGVRPFTTIKQDFGTVSIEAEARDVQHFAVETSYLAAVVKGTKFTVIATEVGAAVQVKRGHVFVEDSRGQSTTTVSAGQNAAVAKGTTISVSGRGKLPEVVAKSGKIIKPKTGSGTLEDVLSAAKLAEKARRDAEKTARKDSGPRSKVQKDDKPKGGEKPKGPEKPKGAGNPKGGRESRSL